ncbi:TetR/AcrR family transcriptional regulator [Protaetiibacter intestinalis]|uniref:TetR/AcrR family transcriptional regulator n=1 Tax=Protaetiibacter intestinalis TaxID=2419774 RepID=A0A387B8L1_9MICO|nr:TetR/AcrR family transcriptional regulator [Protaetiibacter intestinalis]AYF98683.1 TetR/AcrR family transcriptional regulator [Protaetiibacter intestinalis]
MSEPRALGRPADPALDDALIAAAIAELIELGYAGLTTAGVARRAGSSTAAIYRRWRSKQELVADTAARLVDDALAPVDTGTLAGDLAELLAHKHAAMAGGVGTALLTLIGASSHDEELAAVLRAEVFGRTRARVEQVLAQAAARGERVAGVDATAFAMLLTMAGLSPLIVGDGIPDAAYVRLLTAAVHHAGE